MACLLIVAWATVFTTMIRAVIAKDILWPQKQEDRDEGGWKSTFNETSSSNISNVDSFRRRNGATNRNEQSEGTDREGLESHPTDWATRRSKPQESVPNLESSQFGVEGLIEQPMRGTVLKPDDDIV